VSQLLRLERERFHALLGGHPDLGAKVLWRLAQTLSLRLDELYEHRDREDPPRWNDDTKGVGLFPSPFGQTKPDGD
jgi:hypothetical protein